jgi:hypothetical protein
VEADADVCDSVAPAVRHKARTTAPHFGLQPVHPLPTGYRLPFFTPFCYSPRGASVRAERSRRLRDLVKRADAATLGACCRRVAAMVEEGGVAADFLAPATVLVPIPRRIPHDPLGPVSAPEAIARALRVADLAGVVCPALRRWRAVPKSAWSRPGSRPEFLEHFHSLEFADAIELPITDPQALHLLLVDDFITRGRTLLAAAALLYQSFPYARICAFALVRTEGLAPDIAAIASPVTGVIRYLGGDAFRSP